MIFSFKIRFLTPISFVFLKEYINTVILIEVSRVLDICIKSYEEKKAHTSFNIKVKTKLLK